MGASGDQRAELKSRLVGLLRPVIHDHGAELVDLELAGALGNCTVRLLVHRDPGATISLCEQISLEVGDLLDLHELVPGRYRIEVTSPGFDRPLKTDRDFARAFSRLIKVVQPSGRTLIGRLVEWEAESICLETEKGRERISRQQIAKATIEAEF
ncbi:MAG: ribosome maturation factor RimP [Candidatus Latescibacteria bacterium]|nr:ribosome maturation factor RimP [Candidatus Latescibacterota bacterium]